jgi:hypothetical protein
MDIDSNQYKGYGAWNKMHNGIHILKSLGGSSPLATVIIFNPAERRGTRIIWINFSK